MKKDLIIKEFINQIDKDIQKLDLDERSQLTDWFMANQLTNNKRIMTLLESWENSSSVLQLRIF